MSVRRRLRSKAFRNDLSKKKSMKMRPPSFVNDIFIVWTSDNTNKYFTICCIVWTRLQVMIWGKKIWTVRQ